MVCNVVTSFLLPLGDPITSIMEIYGREYIKSGHYVHEVQFRADRQVISVYSYSRMLEERKFLKNLADYTFYLTFIWTVILVSVPTISPAV